MQQLDKVGKLIEWFAHAALRHAEAIEALHDESASVQVENLNRFFAALVREGGLERFLGLLDHEDPAVAGMAAVFAMRLAPERCRAVLAGLAGRPGLLGFRAQAALDRWDAGEWPE